MYLIYEDAMPKNSRKFRQKVQALKKIGDMPDLEAQAIAKVAKLIRMKRKRLILRGPECEIIGHLVIKGDKLRLQTANGMEPVIENGCVVMNMPKPPEKKKKKEQVESNKKD